jgi:hypothetical protein
MVGAPKCGTTAMYGYLRQHPDLFLPERKELRYFGRDLQIRDRRKLSLEEYIGYFSPAPPDVRIGTAYVWYLFSRSAAHEIFEFNPEARIIAMVRNPLEMLPALHAEHLSNGNENIADFTAALAAESDRRQGHRIPQHAHLPQGLEYSRVPRYAEQLERYFTVFGRERVHVIVFDDFARSPDRAYREALQFLGVRDDFTPPSFPVINASKRLRSERLRHLLARPPDLPRRIIRHIVPAGLRRAAFERAKGWNVVPARRPPVPADTVEQMRAMFVDDVGRLSRLLGRDLRHWITPSRDAGGRTEGLEVAGDSTGP